MKNHPLLEKYLSRFNLKGGELPQDQTSWSGFVEIVNQFLLEAENDRKMMEHSLEMCSVEMTALYENLKKTSESIISKERDKLQAVIDSVPGFVCWISRQRTYLGVNQLMASFLEVPASDFLGQEVGFVDPARESAIQLNSFLNSDSTQTTWEINSIAANHRREYYLIKARKYQDGEAVVLIGSDITDRKLHEVFLRTSHDQLEVRVRERTSELENQILERKRTEEVLIKTETQLRQSQKMEAIGCLAGGVAHDFNNLLAVVICFAELSLESLRAEDPLRKNLEAILHAGNRGADLTRQLLAFTRQQVLEPKVLDLNVTLNSMKGLLPRLLVESIELQITSDRMLGKIKADAGQIEQVIMNLVVNARDAMPKGGKLKLSLTNTSVTPEVLSKHLGSVPGREGPAILLEVSDTGSGMDEATVLRIFEPFFTTKEKGKGTGLGLSTVLGVVEQSHGLILVDTKLGKGTSFKIYFPLTDEVGVHREDSVDGGLSTRGSETLLVVEDEPELRELIVQILEGYGYTVIPAKDPAEAIELAAKQTKPLHLVLTDVIMPGMGGVELVEKLSKSYPSLRVLFMSGYTDDAVLANGVESARLAFIQKPFKPSSLALRIREVLDA